MLVAHWVDQWVSSEAQVFISLGVILLCIAVSILYSIAKNKSSAQTN
jgi:hypothetical protein